MNSFQKGLNKFMSEKEYSKVQKIFGKLGLEEITNDRQIANGTIMFADPKCTWKEKDFDVNDRGELVTITTERRIAYGIYNSGYMRRRKKGWIGDAVYQLNPTKDEYGYDEVSKILFPGQYAKMAKMLKRDNIKKYRKTWDKKRAGSKEY